jgi:hypothetical protein
LEVQRGANNSSPEEESMLGNATSFGRGQIPWNNLLITNGHRWGNNIKIDLK